MNSKIIALLVTLVVISLCADPDWTDQDNWGGQCNKAESLHQSPINLDSKTTKFCPKGDLVFVELSCHQFDTSLSSGGTYTSKVNDAGVIITESNFDGSLIRGVGTGQQIQFHSPSEHTINGKSYDLEMHISFDGLAKSFWKFEIINVDIPGKDSAQTAASFVSGTPVQASKMIVSYLFETSSLVSDTDILGFNTGKTDFNKIFGCTTDRFFYRYSGSLTVPPCTEGVQRFVHRETIKISATELAFIKGKLTANNNRKLKAQGTRTARIAGTSCNLFEVV